MESPIGNNARTPAPSRKMRLPHWSFENIQTTVSRTLPLFILILGMLMIGGSLLLTLRHLNTALMQDAQPRSPIINAAPASSDFEDQKTNLPPLDDDQLQNPFQIET